MKRLPQNESDHQLLHLLKSYRPVPPSASLHLEQELMAKIAKQPLSSPYFFHWRWIVPSAIAAAGLVVMGSYRWFAPTPQIATNSQEIEAFLMDSWVGTMGESSVSISQVNNSDLLWLTMTSP